MTLLPRLSLLVFLLLACSSPASRPGPAGTEDPVLSPIGAIVSEGTPPGALCAWTVADATTGETLGGQFADLRLHPGSTMKVVTAAAFCALGGLERPIATSLHVTSEGELVLFGGGDPFLSPEDLRVLAAAVPQELRDAPIVVDASLFGRPRFGAGWMWDDEPAGWHPFISALTLEGGAVTVRGTVDSEGNLFWTSDPHTGWFRRVDEAERVPGSVTRGLGTEHRLIRVPTRPGEDRAAISRSLSVRDPDIWTGIAFRRALQMAGEVAGAIDDEGPLPDGKPPEADDFRVTRRLGGLVSLASARQLGEIRRDPRELLRRTLLNSDNHAAESLLGLIGAWRDPGAGARGGDARTQGLRAVRTWLESLGIDPVDHALADGSGVSHYGLVTPRTLVRVLQAVDALSQERRTAFLESLPVLGRSGTLARRGVGQEGAERVRAKTGSLRAVSCLAGEVTTAGGRRLHFAIMVQHAESNAVSRSLQDRMVLALSRAD